VANFVPEMHDLGKLCKELRAVPTIDGQLVDPHTHTGPSFSNVDWTKWGVEEPTTGTWAAICHHGDPAYRQLPDQGTAEELEKARSVFLTVLADHLAATAGRALGDEIKEQFEKREEVHRLWNPGFAVALKAAPLPVADEKALRQALTLVADSEKDFADYQRKYGANMRVCPEDKDAARRVTSLLSHLELTGKFYRVLDGVVTLLDGPPRLAMDGVEVTKVRKAEAQWVGRLVRATVQFHQQPVRPADLGIFDRWRDCQVEFARAYPDHLLFASGDTLWLFLPGPDTPSLKETLTIFTSQGFYVESETRTAPLNQLGVWLSEALQRQIRPDLEAQREETVQQLAKLEKKIADWDQRYRELGEQIKLTPGPERQALIEERKRVGQQQREAPTVKKTKEQILETLEAALKQTERPELVAEAFYSQDILEAPFFDPPLCEICQMRPGEAVEVAATTDYLCPQCQALRQGGFRQRDLRDWLEQGRGDVLWVRVVLDGEALEPTVEALFGVYVDGLKTQGGEGLERGQRAAMRANLRMPALLRDFVGDYQALLEEMGHFLKGLGDPKRFAALTTDTWVLPVKNGSQLYDVLARYEKLVEAYFPALVPGQKEKPPVEISIRLGMSLGPAKYPFYQHWRYISAPPQPVSVRVVGKEPLEVGLAGLRALLAAAVHTGERDASQGRTYLHKLSGIERRSGNTALALAVFLSDLADRSIPSILADLKEPLKTGTLQMGDILAWEKIITWGKKGVARKKTGRKEGRRTGR